MAKYPGVIPTLDEIFKVTDYVDWVKGEEWNDMRAEIRAALVELGTDPAGTFATVKARLDAMLPHFNDRGDPVLADFDKDDLTTDATWRDLDLSSIVPAGAKAVLLTVALLDDAISSLIQFRENGNTQGVNVAIMRTQVANLSYANDVVVGCDTNRIIEYYASNLTFTSITIAVKGWWK